MAVSPLKLVRERARQAATNDALYFTKPIYFFELRLPQELLGVASSPAILFPLIVGPNAYSMEEPFTLEATPTQGGGLYVEENGIVQRMIRLRGTTGFKPRQLNSASFTGGAGTQALFLLSPDSKSYSRSLEPFILDAISGQRHFHYLQDAVFRTYADLKRDPAYSAETKLFFHNPKDDESWRVAPQRFMLDRNATKPTLYDYNIELLVMDRADAVDADFSEDQGLMDRIKDKIRMVKSGLDLAAGALNDLTAIAADIQNLVKDVAKIIDGATTVVNAASDFVDGVTNLIEAPYAVLESVNGLVDSANDFVATVEEAVDDVREVPDTVRQKLRQISDGINRIGTHPEAFEQPSQKKIREIKGRQELLTSISTATRNLASNTAPPSTIEEVNNLGTGVTAGDVTSAAAELGVGRDIRQYTGAREIAIEEGDTLVNLAAKFLGDARLWQHIAIINGLRPPFIDEQADALIASDESPLPGTLGRGGKILIPNFSKPPVQQPQLPVLGARLEDSAEVQFLGIDMAFEDVGGREGAQLFDIPVDVEGGSVDVKTVRGLNNMKQSLIIRLRTEQGTDILYKNVGLPRIIGLNNRPLDLQTARFRLIQSLEADGRVAAVRQVLFENDNDILNADITLELRGFSDSTNVQIPVR